jgi:hypothetical protein
MEPRGLSTGRGRGRIDPVMDLRSNPRAVAAAKQIEARTGFDVLDESQVQQAVAMCAARGARAVRTAVVCGALAAAIAAALAVALAFGHASTYALVLGSVLLTINLVRAGQALWSARRFGRIPRSIEIMRAEVREAGRVAPSRDRAQWN